MKKRIVTLEMKDTRESSPLAKMVQGKVFTWSAPKARKMNGQVPNVPKVSKIPG